MLIYTPHITPRISYIVDYLNEKLHLGAVLTNDKLLFTSHQTHKVSYSSVRLDPVSFWIQPSGLLTQSDIRKQQIDCFEWKGQLAFFETEDDLGFDLFSALFYLLSRYEEYLEHDPDLYGRYAHQNSLAWREDFLKNPLIDSWLQQLKQILKLHFPAIRFHDAAFQFLPSYDIDIAWSYLQKGFWRTAAATVRNPSTLIKRIKVLLGKERDPFDSYDWLQALHAKHQLKPLYFFLVAEKRSELDKNISPARKELQQLIRTLAATAETGLHPSVYSTTHKECLLKELESLRQILQKPVTKSRHHFLKMNLPHSYRELIAAGITDDYSMGYGTVNGFRASTSQSFLWYNLEREETSTLRVHPFVWMEANSFYEMKHNPEQAFQELYHLYEAVKIVNGTFITVWHNHFLGTDPMFNGWKEMYQQFIATISE